MEQSTLAIIIVVLAVVLFVINKISLVLVSTFAMLAMFFSGILTFEDAFAAFSNTVVMLLAGMLIIGEAFFTTGLAEKIGSLLYRFVGAKEKMFIIIVFVFSMVTTVFFNSMVIMAIFIPIIDSLSMQSGGTITRKHTYLPVAIAGVIGSNLSIIGSTSMLSASGLLGASPFGRPMTFFEPALAALPSCIVCLIIYFTFGYSFQKKCFDFEEKPLTIEKASAKLPDQPQWKMWLTGIVLIICVLGFIFSDFNMGAIAICGAAILMLTRCIDEKTAFRNIDWSTIILIATSIGFAKGVEISGAGEKIAHFFIDIAGPLGKSAFGMCVLMLFLGTLLSNFMSNNAAVTILVPIAVVIAQQLDASMLAYVLAVAIGANISLATPICVATITMTAIVGYRTKDYLRVGGLFNAASFFATAASLYFLYFR